eukprot:9494734-Pyramimonas_sp.AAC.1
MGAAGAPGALFLAREGAASAQVDEPRQLVGATCPLFPDLFPKTSTDAEHAASALPALRSGAPETIRDPKRRSLATIAVRSWSDQQGWHKAKRSYPSFARSKRTENPTSTGTNWPIILLVWELGPTASNCECELNAPGFEGCQNIVVGVCTILQEWPPCLELGWTPLTTHPPEEGCG